MRRRKALAVGVVLALAILSGCSSVASGPEYSVSDPELVVQDGNPGLVFNYNASDYATLLVEAPNGEIVRETRINPNGSRGGVAMREFQSGQYRLVLREGGDTVADTTLNVSGPSTEVASVSADWSSNEFEGVTMWVHNNGDVPVKVENVEAQTMGETISVYSSEWIAPNSSKMVSVKPKSDYIKVRDSGTVYGEVSVETSEGTITDGFSKKFEPAKLTITSTSAKWDGAELEYVTVKVRNSGDVPTKTRAYVQNGETIVSKSFDESIDPGESQVFNVTEYSMFTANTPGTAELQVGVTPSKGADETTVTTEVEPANLTVTDVEPEWGEDGLLDVTYKVTNNGDLEGQFRAVLTVNGEVVDGELMSGESGFVGPQRTKSYTLGTVWGYLYKGDQENTDVELKIVKTDDD